MIFQSELLVLQRISNISKICRVVLHLCYDMLRLKEKCWPVQPVHTCSKKMRNSTLSPFGRKQTCVFLCIVRNSWKCSDVSCFLHASSCGVALFWPVAAKKMLVIFTHQNNSSSQSHPNKSSHVWLTNVEKNNEKQSITESRSLVTFRFGVLQIGLHCRDVMAHRSKDLVHLRPTKMVMSPMSPRKEWDLTLGIKCLGFNLWVNLWKLVVDKEKSGLQQQT